MEFTMRLSFMLKIVPPGKGHVTDLQTETDRHLLVMYTERIKPRKKADCYNNYILTAIIIIMEAIWKYDAYQCKITIQPPLIPTPLTSATSTL